MKYSFTILCLALMSVAAWKLGSQSVGVVELKTDIAKINKTHFDKRGIKRTSLYNDKKPITQRIKIAGDNEPERLSAKIFNTKTSAKISKSELLSKKYKAETPQEEENEVLANFKDQEDQLIQEISDSNKSSVTEYKQRVLTKLFSSKPSTGITDHNPTVSEADVVTQVEPSEDFESIAALEQLNVQNRSETIIEDSLEDFNFSKQKTVELDLSPETSNGKVLPNMRLTIENSQGQILLESSTDIRGKFQGELTVFAGEDIYVRYFGIGISQEKVEITNIGEKE